MKKIFSLIVLCLIFIQAIVLHAAGTPWYGVTIRFRENGKDYEVTLPDFFGTLYNIKNVDSPVENCTTGSHITNAGNRFEHFHVTFSIPATGIYVAPFLITEAKVRDYWDFYYACRGTAPYTGGGGATFVTNCWGKTLGYNDCWVNDPFNIYKDNYDPVSVNPPTPIPPRQHVHRIFSSKGDSHVEELTQCLIYEVWNPGPTGALIRASWYHKIVTTEKNRDSGIYVEDCSTLYGGMGPPVFYDIYIKK